MTRQMNAGANRRLSCASSFRPSFSPPPYSPFRPCSFSRSFTLVLLARTSPSRGCVNWGGGMTVDVCVCMCVMCVCVCVCVGLWAARVSLDWLAFRRVQRWDLDKQGSGFKGPSQHELEASSRTRTCETGPMAIDDAHTHQASSRAAQKPYRA